MPTTVSTPRKIVATVSASATLAKGRHTPTDATAGPLTMTLPTDAPAGVEISVEKIDGSANVVTISGTLRGSASTIALIGQFEARTFLSEGAGSWRPTSDHRPATSLAAPEVWDRFEDKSDGSPGTARSGQTWILSGGTVGATAKPTVVSGKLTSTPASSASYAEVPTARSLRRIGGKFTLGAYTTGNGSVTLGGWDRSIAGSFPRIPDSNCHLVVSPTTWIFGVWSGNAFTQVKSGSFATPLTADGVTEYAVEVYVDKASSTAYVFSPDGLVTVVSHALIGSVASTYAFWETFQQASTDSHGAWSSVWAETRHSSGIAVAKTIATLPQQPVVETFLAPASSVSALIPGSMTDVGQGTTITFRAPASGSVRVELSGFVQNNGASRVLWQLAEGATGKRTWTVVDGAIKTRANVDCVITGLNPGSSYTYKWQHMGTTANVGFLMLDNPNGYSASMTVTPL